MREFVLLAACLLLGASASAAPGYRPASAERGKELAAPCIACHGVEGMQAGDPAFHIPKIGGQRPEAIFYALRDYKSSARQSDIMAPMVESLSEQDMRDLGAYLSAGGPAYPHSAGAGSWAYEKNRKDCTACHGESGVGVMPGIPVIAGQHKDYLIHALNAYRSGARSHATMGLVAQKLTPDEIEKMAEYFSIQGHLEITQ